MAPNEQEGHSTGTAWIENKTILTRTSGFLGKGFTHTINVYHGCAFAHSLCGIFCYAQHNSWITKGRPWGFYGSKHNLRDTYRRDYNRWKQSRDRNPRPLNIFMSSSTDPYMPQEHRFRRTQSLLEEMLKSPPDVLVIQTHSPLIVRDIELITQLSDRCKELWVSVTVETDIDHLPGFPPHATSPAKRIKVLKQFRHRNVRTQATLSPLLPLADFGKFAHDLDLACERIILDHYLLGDGAHGVRTKRTGFPQLLEQAGFEEWTRLDRFWEVRDFMARALGHERVLVSCEGFNTVGGAQ